MYPSSGLWEWPHTVMMRRYPWVLRCALIPGVSLCRPCPKSCIVLSDRSDRSDRLAPCEILVILNLDNLRNLRIKCARNPFWTPFIYRVEVPPSVGWAPHRQNQGHGKKFSVWVNFWQDLRRQMHKNTMFPASCFLSTTKEYQQRELA